MQVKSIAECSKGSILQHFRPSLSYHFDNDLCFVYFEWPFYTGFTVLHLCHKASHSTNLIESSGLGEDSISHKWSQDSQADRLSDTGDHNIDATCLDKHKFSA